MRILQMISRHQDQLQLPACLEALRRFFPLQQISDELPLIRGRPFATAKWIQEYETVPDEHRTENLRGLLECLAKLEIVLPGSVTSAVMEYDRGKTDRDLRASTKSPSVEDRHSKSRQFAVAAVQRLARLPRWESPARL